MNLAATRYRGMQIRTLTEMGKRSFRVVLSDGNILFMSPAQKRLFDDETGSQRRYLLEHMEVVMFEGTIEDALAGMDARGNAK